MTFRHLIDPELAGMVGAGPALELSDATLPEARAMMGSLLAAEPSPALRSEVYVPAGDASPDVRLIVHMPPGAGTNRPAIFYVHGGGMVLGSATMREGTDGAMALRHGAVVVAVDYRLAPETPFPGPVEDCLAGLVWLFANAASLGVDPSRIALMGSSAGGGLAASLAQLARDTGGPCACAQFLIYPMLDHRTGSRQDPHPNPVTGEFGWTRELNRYGWEALRGDYAADDERAGHFSASLGRLSPDLPPAFIATGSLDLFFEEILDYSSRLCRAGVPVELHSYPGAVHGFDMIAAARVSRQFQHDLDEALSRALGS